MILRVIASLAVLVLMLAAEWKLFTKAGIAGWKALIPIYNIYLSFKICFGNGWLFLLLFIPIVGIVVSIMYPFKMAKAFGKSGLFGLGLLFLSVIFIPVLAFSDAIYQGPMLQPKEEDNIVVEQL